MSDVDYKNKDGDLMAKSPLELQALFLKLDAEVKAVEPQVLGMEATAAEARMILNDIIYRRGRAAFAYTAKKG